MARWKELTPQEEKDWAAWLAERPACIREVATKFPPWELYLLKSSGHRVKIDSYQEPKPPTGQVRDVHFLVFVSAEFNLLAFERQVFGIPQNDLEPCDFPPHDEIVGSADIDPDTARQWMRERKWDSHALEWYVNKYGANAAAKKFRPYGEVANLS